jgi:hypothetical protein
MEGSTTAERTTTTPLTATIKAVPKIMSEIGEGPVAPVKFTDQGPQEKAAGDKSSVVNIITVDLSDFIRDKKRNGNGSSHSDRNIDRNRNRNNRRNGSGNSNRSTSRNDNRNGRNSKDENKNAKRGDSSRNRGDNATIVRFPVKSVQLISPAAILSTPLQSLRGPPVKKNKT